jgi:nucleotide-binding universal stress UspA family protein
MKRFKNILFVADREGDLETTLEKAVAVSTTNSARLTVMDITADTSIVRYLQRAHPADLNAQLREARLRDLDHLTRPYRSSTLQLATTVRTGTPFIEIIRAVQRNRHDLVIKTAQQDGSIESSLFGSTDMHLLRKCPCPVWIDRPGGAALYDRVLAAVDPFEDESGNLPRLILDLATSLAERENADLEIVHAWELPGESMLASGRIRFPRGELAPLLTETERHHRNALDRLLSAYRLSSDSPNVRLRKGRPSEVISGHASDSNTNLIVMGTLGRLGIPGLLIGNTAEEVLRNTRTSVLTVKPEGFASPVN